MGHARADRLGNGIARASGRTPSAARVEPVADKTLLHALAQAQACDLSTERQRHILLLPWEPTKNW